MPLLLPATLIATVASQIRLLQDYPEWADRLHPAREDELFKLDELPVLEATSRLSCQILWDETLDGLTLTLAEIA